MKLERFAYFMVRIRQEPGGASAGPVTGMVERLATGEKRNFSSGAELLETVRDWPVSPPNVPAEQVDSQPFETVDEESRRRHSPVPFPEEES